MIDRGVNYINLGFPQLFENPEKACGYIKEALADGYREKVKLSVNIPACGALSHQELSDALAAQLELFGFDTVDFCVIDGVNRAAWASLKELDISSWVQKLSDGGIYVGLAFHDDPHYLKDINETCPQWAFIQIELSILDYKHHPGVGGFKFTQEYGNGVIATDITKAGRVLRNVPANVVDVLDTAQVKCVTDERCLKWVLNFEEVSSVQLSVESECPTVEYAEKCLTCASAVVPGSMDVWETLDSARMRDAYYANREYLCTTCYCCMPCAVGIDVPRIIELVNDEKMFSDSRLPRLQYNLERHHDIKCAECGLCDRSCPKRFPLQKIVRDAKSAYAYE